MDHQRQRLEIQIEQLRTKMHHAYENSAGYDQLMDISTQLDKLLNELEILNRNQS
ncbi:Spo0E family sporulation regulatory protein-aspartic acid phosphatase [Oceanobacillus sp. FSL H7-0719]|uniref:Spo0E family sporulation regulatory protein-aspartic acid phosphatase n=1 Tax=Oceanobacillus sp. FSL H7-0719 TaxID=2954507 RepID=UPI00324FFCF3